MSHLWQHPYVNVFKHFDVGTWKKSSKEGEVVSQMDKTLKCTVYRIAGSIPAGNFIQLPKTSSQSLGLTGRYLYLLFKPIPGKYFVVHIDVASQDGLIVRISFSNLFKEFKSTSTWLQFPFICHAATGSVSDRASAGSKDNSGPAPLHTRYTVLCLDVTSVVSVYLNRKYSYLKSIKLCANMLVKNIFTSDNLFEPGITLEQVKRLALDMSGQHAMPREMSFPLAKTQKWHDTYDLIRFPNDASKKPFDSIQFVSGKGGIKATLIEPAQRIEPRTVDVTRSVSDKVGVIGQATEPKLKGPKKKPVSELPRVGVDEYGEVHGASLTNESEVHVYAHPNEPIKGGKGRENARKVAPVVPSAIHATEAYQSLKPDPIMKLRRIVGFGGANARDALWTSNGTTVVYPCHAVVVAMQVSNGHQRFFIGHTDKVSCISMNGSCTLLASGQTGQQSVVRVWKFQSAECLAMFKTHVHSLNTMSMSHNGGVLCGVGKDSHGKNMVVIWNITKIHKGGQVAVMAKAHTDVDIVRMRISNFDDTRMVSCGRDNIRLWRVKDGSLRSAPVNLGEYHAMEFTDCCFETSYDPTKDPLDRTVYACSKTGHIFEVNYLKVAIKHVRRLLPVVEGKQKGEKQTFNSGCGLAINSLCVNEAFCVTGSDDGFLRLWPLDFKHVYLEAEHEGPVTSVDISTDGIKIIAGTSSGNLGILDVSTRGYCTVMRSHTGRIRCMALDPIRRHIATVSEDHTIRIWDLDNMQQLYDFSAPKEMPCTIAYHPNKQVFACGFESGSVRAFNVASTSMLAEHRQHRGKVVGLAYAPDGSFLYSAGSQGTIALYDSADQGYQLLRVLANTIARGERYGPDAIAVSPDGRTIAFVGPSEFTVSVVNSRTLDEVMRIDITSINPPDSQRDAIDAALKVKYSPGNVRQLLVTTTKNKLLKFDSRNGKIVSEIDNIHRLDCSALDVSQDGKYLATAGDKVIKIWDYHMRLDLNFQVFIGHAEAIQTVLFAPDSCSFISTGEGIFIWDFLANALDPLPDLQGRTSAKSYYTGRDEPWSPYNSPSKGLSKPVQAAPIPPASVHSDTPRKNAPKPAMYEPGMQVADISYIQQYQLDGIHGQDIVSVASEKEGSECMEDNDGEAEESGMEDHGAQEGHLEEIFQRDARIHTANEISNVKVQVVPEKKNDNQQSANHPKPKVHKHFCAKEKRFGLAQRRYTAPPSQAGLQLKSVIGYNGNGRDNMVWNPDIGFFAYTSGMTVIVEDLDGGKQQHLHGHSEEVSTIALQHDCQVLASASGQRGVSPSQIIIWDLQQMVFKKVLNHHSNDIVALAYSRDDRFLVSVGDYRDCSVVIWSTNNYTHLASTKTSVPVHDISWDPYACNEFASVGANNTVLFWLLDETTTNVSLNVHEAEVPVELTHQTGGGDGTDFTCLEYAGDSTLYVGTSTGQMSAWDTRRNTCFMHWEADTTEIECIISKGTRLITGSLGKSLRLWCTSGVNDMRQGSKQQSPITMEDEMNLDAAISVASFDDTMDMGIVGTEAGTLWYINWTERTSIRLVSGHSTHINAIGTLGSEYLSTCGQDGSLRLWSVSDREQMLQFQVMGHPCNCMAFSPVRNVNQDAKQLPAIAAGYGDGTVRMFDLNLVEMVLKMHPHAAAVTAITFSSDGRMILSGSVDGLVAVSSPTTGMTVRVIGDHKGAPITGLDVTVLQDQEMGVSSPQLWLTSSADGRVSVWSADWTKDFCELVDWLTFPAPAYTPDGEVVNKIDGNYFSQVPPTLAVFSREEPDVVVYTGYGMQKALQFYSLSDRKILRTCNLTHWATSLDVSPKAPLIAVGNNERLMKLIDYYEGSFQDFTGHNDSLSLTRFSKDGKLLVTVADNEVMVWDVAV